MEIFSYFYIFEYVLYSPTTVPKIVKIQVGHVKCCVHLTWNAPIGRFQVTCVTIQTRFFNFEIILCLKYSLIYQNFCLTWNFSQFPVKITLVFPDRTIPSYLKSSVDFVTCVTSDKWAFSKFWVCLYFSVNYEDLIQGKYNHLIGNECKFLLAKISSL